MVCTTFLHDSELNVRTSNDEINTMLAEVREATGKDWQVVERTHTASKGFLFWKKKFTYRSYELYVYVGGMGPWQVINFYRDAPVGQFKSINFSNSAELVVAFFYGIMSGVWSERNKETQK